MTWIYEVFDIDYPCLGKWLSFLSQSLCVAFSNFVRFFIMGLDQYASVYLLGVWQFNLLFVLEWVLAIVAALFMLFYWNRLMGSVLSLSVRWYFWHYHKALVKVQSIQVSVLAGRIFFKNFTYLASNETISILQGSFTWRYWLHKRRLSLYSQASLGVTNNKEEPDLDGQWKPKKLIPSRLKLAIEGVEWYIYNRSPAFDIIEESLKNAEANLAEPEAPQSASPNENNYQNSESSFDEDEKNVSAPISPVEEGEETSSRPESSAIAPEDLSTHHINKYGKIGALVSHLQSIKEVTHNNGSGETAANEGRRISEPEQPRVFLTHGDSMMLRLLPIDLKMTKGAVVIGNHTTPSLLVFQFASGTGFVDADRSRNKLDKYRTIYHGDISKPVIDMRANIDYEGNLHFKQEIERMTQKFQFSKLTVLVLNAYSAISQFLRRTFKEDRNKNEKDVKDGSSAEDEPKPWKGLDRYKIDSDTELRDLLQKDAALSGGYDPEYGRVSTILDASEGSITLHYDSPGVVPDMYHLEETVGELDIGNSGSAPEWGSELSFKDATVYYGPWTDRQRIAIQRMLVPQSCQDGIPRKKLQPGDTREYVDFKVNINIDKNSIIRIPMRENSKNTQFHEAHSEELKDKGSDFHIMRPFGWIEITGVDMTDIYFSTAMAASDAGWKQLLHVEIGQLELRSSVNHALLYKANRFTINADMSSPLVWNGLQEWLLVCDSYDAECFLMREHIVLFADLVSDFSDSPPTPYDLFTPFIYKFSWNIHNSYKFYLNINDHNIVNNPLDFSENIYMIFQGEDLIADITIPLDQVFQKKNTIPFDISTPRFDLSISSPPWNTLYSFLDRNQVGRAYQVDLKGSYTYFSSAEPGYSDTLILEADADDVSLILYGFVISYFLKLRENYFGEFTHFQTFEEFENSEISQIDPPEDDTPQKSEFTHLKTDIDLDVLIYAFVNNGSVILPANIYSAESNVLLSFASLDFDTRFTNYYMDLQVNISPIKGIHYQKLDPDSLLDCARNRISFDPTIFIDGLFIHGHRVFGLPPSEPTYFCKWDFDLGEVLLNGPLEVLEYLGNAIHSIAYTYSDTENGLLIREPIIYDVTYLSLSIASLKLRLKEKDNILEAITSQISLNFTDLANERYSARMTLSIPQVQVKAMKLKPDQAPSDSTDPSSDENYDVLAFFKTSILITDFIQKRDSENHREKQQQHIAMHDAPFDRCSFLLDKDHRFFHQKPMGNIIPSIPLPVIPPPLTKETVSLIDPNLSNSLGKEDREENGTSVSSKSKYSSTEDSYSSEDDEEEDSRQNDDNKSGKHSMRFSVGGSTFAGNAFMPPESWSKFEQISKNLNGKLPKFEMNPTSYYSSDEGIVPRFKVKPDTEYDSVIVQLGDVTGFLVPMSIVAFNELFGNQCSSDLQSTMDLIQVEVLNRLNFIRTAQPMVKNFKILISSISLKYGTASDSDANMMMERYESELSHLLAQFESINISLRITQPNYPQDIQEFLRKGMQDIPFQVTAYSNCEKILFSIVRGSSDGDENFVTSQYFRPLFLQLDNPDFWWCETDNQNTGFFHLKNINLSVLNDSIPWIAKFVEKNIQAISCVKKEQTPALNHTRQLRCAYVLSLLSAAGESFKIEDDPSVLTRPAYIIRSRHHVRTNDSWKIIMRLRHILQSVPRRWRDKYDNIVKTNTYRINIEAAQREVLRVFRKWRSWEMVGMDESYVFRHVFNVKTLQDTLLSKSASLNIDLESIAVRINYHEDENFLCLDYMKLSFGWKGKDDKEKHEAHEQGNGAYIENSKHEIPLDVECITNCSNIRVLLDTKILSTIQLVDKTICTYKIQSTQNSELESRTESGESVTNKSSTQTSVNIEDDNNPSLIPPLKLSVAGCFQNISLLLDLITIGVGYESHDITFSGNLTQLQDVGSDILLDFCFVSHFKEIELSLREKLKSNQERNLANVLLADYKGTVVSHGSLKEDLKHAFFSHEKFAVVVDAPVERLIQIADRFLDNDLKLFESSLMDLKENHNEVSSAIFPVKTEQDISDLNVSVNPNRVQHLLDSISFILRFSGRDSSFQFNVTDSLSLYLSMTDFSFASTLREGSKMAFEVSISEEQLELLTCNPQSMDIRQLFVVTIPSIDTLILREKFDNKEFIESVVNIRTIESRMMSLSSLLLIVKSETVEKEITSMIKSVDSFTKRLGSLVKDDDSVIIEPAPELQSLVNTSAVTHFNLTVSISETVVVFPSFDSSLVLKLDDIRTTLSSFSYQIDTRFALTPFFAEMSVNDAVLDLSNDTWGASSASEILRLQISMSYRGRDEITNKQRVDISSDQVHIMLCQRIVEKLVNIANTLEEGIGDFYPTALKEYEAMKAQPINSQPSISLDESVKEHFKALKKIGERTTLRMSLSDFCFAWLYEEDYAEDLYPVSLESKGILFGYDSLQITTSNLYGKTLLSGVYITPTYDDQNIFATAEDKSLLMNTAYLPSVKLSFLADLSLTSPRVYVKLIGDSLRVTVLPSIVGIVVCLSRCISNTLDACNASSSSVSHADTSPKASSPAISKLLGTDSSGKFSLPLSFRFSVSFDGATITLYKDLPYSHSRRLSFNPYQFSNNADSNVNKNDEENEPAVSLQSPAINAKIEYLKGDSSKRDAFNAEILISSSSNKIYPRVVPSIVEMWKLIQNVLKESAFAPEKPNVSSQVDDTLEVDSIPEKISDIAGDHQFRDIVVDINIRLQRQELTLSCEPRARVAATVAYDDFCISFNSFDDTTHKNTNGLSVRLHNFSASLQHVYSREVSGQISVDDMFLFATMGRNSSGQLSILVATKISDISTDVNLKQSEDLKLFQDIWSPESTLRGIRSQSSLTTFSHLSDTIQEQLNPAMLDGAIMRKYRRVTASSAIPWCFDFSLKNVRGTVDLGQAVGQATFTIDQLWLSSQKSSNWEQNLSLGFDEIKIVSQGRFGGVVSLRKIQLSTAIMWQRHNGAIYPVPLVQAILGIESLEARATFDYHSFAVASVNALHLSMFNQRDKNFVLNDRLAVVGNCESIYVFATSLAASNILDLYYTIDRMRSEAHASYNAILRDSANLPSDGSEAKNKKTPSQIFDRLRTFLDVNINLLSINIYPDTLMDAQVFTINVKGAEARYSQETELHEEFDESKMERHKLSMTITKKECVSQLDMRLNGLHVALSTNRKSAGSEDALTSMSIKEYIHLSHDSKGTTIVGIPLCEISMTTWQEVNSNIVEYIFNSSFGGRVDVGWNLGSVNFIRSMWENHARTFNARLKTYEMRYAAGTSSSLRPYFNDADTSLTKKGQSSSSTDPLVHQRQVSEASATLGGAHLNKIMSSDTGVSVSSTASTTSSDDNTTASQADGAGFFDARSVQDSTSVDLSIAPSSDASLEDSISLSEYQDVEEYGDNFAYQGDMDVPQVDDDVNTEYGNSSTSDEINEGGSPRANTAIPPGPSNVNKLTDSEDSKDPPFIYVARAPPIIAQPQLRDMGEATPPVEWIGLHRKKLPSFVHQVIMVPLEKAVEEVDVVYRKVLGRS